MTNLSGERCRISREMGRAGLVKVERSCNTSAFGVLSDWVSVEGVCVLKGHSAGLGCPNPTHSKLRTSPCLAPQDNC